MNVTKDNFELMLPQVISDINTCDFVAIDCEFTGLVKDKRDRIDIMDSASERFQKVSSSVRNFLPIQVGICTFQFKTDGFYEAKPYNFYVFPKSGNRYFGLDRVFATQVGSLEFLLGNNFDFMKWATEGISYVNRDDSERILSRLEDQDIPDPALVEGEAMFEVVQDAIEKVNDFLQNSTKKTMEIPTPSSLHKKAIEKAVQREFNGYVGCTWKRTSIELEKLTEEARKESLRLSRSNVLRDELNELIGFRKVIDVLIEAKKPLVGHNMLHDLCHIFHHFYRSIPVDYEDFQKQIHEIFPMVIDTKMIAYSAPTLQTLINNTTLGDIAKIFNNDPFVYPKIVYGREFEKYIDSENCHEAAYDAYITGLCLLRTTSHVLNHTTSCKFVINYKIHYVNKLFFMQSLSTFMALEGPPGKLIFDIDIPDHSNVFLVEKFPVNWKTTDLQMALKDLGYITIKWVDDQSCLVIVRDKAKVEVAIEMTKKTVKKKSKFIITRFTDPSLATDENENVVEFESPQAWVTAPPSSRKRARTESLETQGAKKAKKSKKSCLVM